MLQYIRPGLKGALMMVEAFFLSCQDMGGKGSTNHPPLALLLFFLSGDKLMHASSTLQARISP